MNNKPLLIAVSTIVALFTLSLVFRYIILSEAGLPGGWLLYMGLPTGGLVAVTLLLIRLGIINFGEKSTVTTAPWQHHSAVPAQPFVAPTSQRLQELENLRTNGTISDTEYSAERARIISGL